jgi:uncharacterized membrane protein YdjX (TVP38/TMEM64 family)
LKRIAVASLLVVGLAAWFLLDLGQYLTLDALKAQQAAIEGFYRANPLLVLATFFAIYVILTALSVPGAVIMTLGAGAVFGVATGTLIVSFASSIGATLAFLASRYLFHDAVQTRFGARLRSVNDGVARDGAFYLFSLRLVPVFPFFAVNLLMGLTPIRTWTYYWVSQTGMLLGTVVYVNAGTQLARIEALSDIASPGLLASFAWGASVGSQVDHGYDQAAARLCTLGTPPALRSQSRRDRRGRGGPCVIADRGDRPGQGDTCRGLEDGRRLPQLWLCPVQGAGQVCTHCGSDAPCRSLRA